MKYYKQNNNKTSTTTLTLITVRALTSVHVELASRRREAVVPSGSRRAAAARCSREQDPRHPFEVEEVQVVEIAYGVRVS